MKISFNIQIKRILLFSVLINLFSSLSAQYSLSGGGDTIRAVDDSQYRLKVYLFNGITGAKISFKSQNQGAHQWYRYNLNANNAEKISSIQDGDISYITDIQDGYGYFVGLPTEALPYYIWIIDYSKYVPRFFSLKTSEEDDKCMYLKILADVEAEPLTYYLPTGLPVNLTRLYHLQYNTLVWEEKNKQFRAKEENMELRGLISEIVIPAPLSNTQFTLKGDNFSEKFGLQQTIVSDEYNAIAVEAHGIAETNKEHADNEKHNTGDALGGSAPIEYTFTAYANEPVAAKYIWRIFQRDSITGQLTLIMPYTEKVLRYNFERDGIFHVELEVSDRQSICVDSTQVFNVIINSTVIKIPNVFSPGSSIGVNDELKISFSSIVSFNASVLNRWGNLLFQWSDPSKGWDGRVNGKFVPTGTYYVIVEYKDSNGKSRTMSKAVNVLRSNR